MLRLVANKYVMLPSCPRLSFRTYSSKVDDELSSSIRALMRDSAQPVAVITSLLPSNQHNSTSPTSSYAHGATLSSFSTISLQPPLLAFSLQTPSRMADALQVNQTKGEKGAHFVINILSEKQASTAAGFAKPGLTPFSLGPDWTTKFSINRHDNDSDHPLSTSPFHASAFAKDISGIPLPILSESLGSLACSIVSVLCLKEFETSADSLSKMKGETDSKNSGSELFLARVHGVEKAVGHGKDERLPLVYWNQNFTSVKA